MTQIKSLLVTSTEPYSGKTGIILGIAQQLQEKGFTIAYGKPLGTCLSEDLHHEEEDIKFITETLKLTQNQVCLPLLSLQPEIIKKRLQGEDTTDYSQFLPQYLAKITADLVLIESPSAIWEGTLFNLSVEHIVSAINASVLLVSRYTSLLLVESLLKAKQSLGDHLLGVVINDIPPEKLSETETLIKPFLQQQNIQVLGLLPRNSLLRSISVREIAHKLQAKVLCRLDRLDLMVETLTIGAMNVNSALEYFRQKKNMAVVTGSDRTDLQLAALETSTNCLILTGHIPPQELVISRAEDLEIPVLSVDLDTLSTVELIDQDFGQVRLQEPIKVECIKSLLTKHFQLDILMEKLGLPSVVTN